MWLFGEVAGDPVLGKDLPGDRRFVAAAGFGQGTARVERTAFGRMNRRREIAWEEDAAPAGRGVESGHG